MRETIVEPREEAKKRTSSRCRNDETKKAGHERREREQDV